MYLSLRERPADPGATAKDATRSAPPAVAPVVVTLGFVSLLTDISSEAVAAVLPIYLTVVIGLSPVAYGFVDGLYQGVSAIVRIGGGAVADLTDRPKWVAFAGYGVSALAKVALLFATGLAAIAAVVTADRLGKGIRTAPRDAMISAASPPAHLGRAFGVHRALDTAGAALGPLIAFALLWAVPDGYRLVFAVSLAFAVVGVALLGLLVPDQSRRSRRSPSDRLETSERRFSWRELANPSLRRLLVVAGVLGVLTVGDGFIYLALLDRSGFAAHWFPLLYVGTNIAYLALAVPVGRLADRVGRARVLVTGHLVLVAAYACALLPTKASVATFGALLLLGAFYAATDGVIAAIAGRLVGSEARASGIAAAQTVVALARMAASAGFGVLWLLLGPQQALLVVGIALVVAVSVAATQIRPIDTAMSDKAMA